MDNQNFGRYLLHSEGVGGRGDCGFEFFDSNFQCLYLFDAKSCGDRSPIHIRGIWLVKALE